MISTKKMLYRITQRLGVDFVTEIGTSGNWRWRKWNSGRTEAWLHEAGATIAITEANGNIYQSSSITRTIPSGISFTTIRFSTVDIKNSGYTAWASTYSCTTSTLSFKAISTLSRASASTYSIDAYIVGYEG